MFHKFKVVFTVSSFVGNPELDLIPEIATECGFIFYNEDFLDFVQKLEITTK